MLQVIVGATELCLCGSAARHHFYCGFASATSAGSPCGIGRSIQMKLWICKCRLATCAVLCFSFRTWNLLADFSMELFAYLLEQSKPIICKCRLATCASADWLHISHTFWSTLTSFLLNLNEWSVLNIWSTCLTAIYYAISSSASRIFPDMSECQIYFTKLAYQAISRNVSFSFKKRNVSWIAWTKAKL